MKARFSNFIILSATFFLLPHLLVGQANIEKLKDVNYCSLFDLPNNYSKQLIKSKAFMTYSTVSRVDGGDSFLYSKECNNGDYFTVTNFSKLNNSSKWKNFFGKLPEEKNFIFEINFTGKLQTSIIPLFGHLGWSRAEIEIIEIHSMKDVTFASGVKKPNFEAETPLIEKSRQLETINNQILLFFLNNSKDEKDTDIYIADNFTIIGTFGKLGLSYKN